MPSPRTASPTSRPPQVFSGATLFDVFELLPLPLYEPFFASFSRFLLAQNLGETEKNTILKLCNVLLKRTSRHLHGPLRAAVQTFQATLYDVRDQSGRNKKSAVFRAHFAADSLDAAPPCFIDPHGYRAAHAFLSDPWARRASGDSVRALQAMAQIATALRQCAVGRWTNCLLEHSALLDSAGALFLVCSHPSFARVFVLQYRFYAQVQRLRLQAREADYVEPSKEERRLLAEVEEHVAQLQRLRLLDAPGGSFADLVQQTLEEEARWIAWKNSRAPAPDAPSEADEARAQKPARGAEQPCSLKRRERTGAPAPHGDCSGVLGLLGWGKVLHVAPCVSENYISVG